MSTSYPVQIEVTSPPRFDRVQLLLRIALAIALAWVGITAGWMVGFLYAALPIVAAISISSSGGDRFGANVAPRMWRVLRWLLQFSAYMSILTDRFPTDHDTGVRVDLQVTGTPTVGSALARLLTSIPSGLVLCLLVGVASILWLVAAVIVLVGRAVPPWIMSYQRGVLRWTARLVAYHASLVEAYPPFAFDTDEGRGVTLAPVAR